MSDHRIAVERNAELLDGTSGVTELGHESGLSGATEHQDAFQALLDRTYNLLNRPALHSHHCSRCHNLRPCLQQPCGARATDQEKDWVCGSCRP